MPTELAIMFWGIVLLAVVGFAIVWNIDRLDRADRRRMREAEQGSSPKAN